MIEKLRRQAETLALGSRILYHEGLVSSVGHLSCRVPGAELMLISPRMSPGLVTPDDVLLMSLDGEVVEGYGEPNSEWPIHTQTYRRRPEVQAIAHVHPPNVILLGIIGEPFRPVHNWGAIFADGVGLYEPVAYIRTVEEGDAMAAALGSQKAVMLRGHGATVVGSSLEDAVVSSIKLEYNATLQIRALSAGKPHYYSEEEIASVEGHNVPRFWQYFSARARGELPQTDRLI